ncbi:hypothetical protein [Shouchella shacheensis]|uniref:hypothetical protein n=1 Tax=Shouchella shacheensis TaxID=1649580 RepID=UPI0012F7C357|nr:hypothetical protein [Shouchella shacheensis]
MMILSEEEGGQYVGYWTATSNRKAEGAEVEAKVTDDQGNEVRETAEGRVDSNSEE